MTTEAAAHFIGKCRKCKKTRRLTAATHEVRQTSKLVGYPYREVPVKHHSYTLVGDATGRKHDTKDHGQISLPCPCGAQTLVCFKRVLGTTNPKIKCNAKCEGATGHVCECSCGGEHHGGAHN